MEEDLIVALRASAAVAALAGDRIEWGARVQGAALPGLVLNVVGGAGGHHFEGPDGLRAARVQIDSYGATYEDARRLSRAVVSALDGRRDGGVRGAFHLGTRDMGPETGTDEAARPYRASDEFMIHWRTT